MISSISQPGCSQIWRSDQSRPPRLDAALESEPERAEQDRSQPSGGEERPIGVFLRGRDIRAGLLRCLK